MEQHIQAMKNGYNPEIVLAFFKECGLPEPISEYQFHPQRKWRFDWCFMPAKLAVECQGGIFSGGAHVRGARLLKEYEKLNRAAALGWKVIFVTPSQLCTMETVTLIKQALAI